MSNLIQRAGGLKNSAYARAARLFRVVQSEEQELRKKRLIFDLEDAIKKPGSDQDLFLRDGDRLEVPRFENVVHVRGRVLNEVSVAHVPGKSVAYYISLAGGYARGADKENVTIVHPDGRKLKQSGFLWFGRREVEPMSVIDVPDLLGPGLKASTVLGNSSP